MLIVIYLLLALAVVLLSIKLSFYVDLLDKKTDISGAFIGGVILAAVTSLPEFFTSLSATIFLDQPGLVIGNILGSNIFNLAAMAVISLIFLRGFRGGKIGRSHKTTLTCATAVYITLTISYLLNFDPHFLTISLFSVAIVVVYFISIKTMSNDEGLPDVDEPLTSDLTLVQISRRFLVCSVLLIVSSIAVTYTTDLLAEQFQLGATFAGALLLGVATSLPELASSINLAKMGNFNAMTGNIVGSNMFNFFILTIADLSYLKSSIYNYTPQTVTLMLLGLLAHIAMMVIITAKTSLFASSKKTGATWVYVIPNLVVIGSYLWFVASCM